MMTGGELHLKHYWCSPLQRVVHSLSMLNLSGHAAPPVHYEPSVGSDAAMEVWETPKLHLYRDSVAEE